MSGMPTTFGLSPDDVSSGRLRTDELSADGLNRNTLSTEKASLLFDVETQFPLEFIKIT